MSATVRLETTIDVRYAGPVERGHHEVRATPATTDVQRPRRTSLAVDPAVWSVSHLDHWGTHVTAVEVEGEHEHLAITSTSVVEVDRAGAALPGGGWDEVRAASSGEAAELIAFHPASPLLDDLVASARAMLFDGALPDDVALAVCALVRSRVTWDGQGPHGAPALAAAESAAACASRAWVVGAGDAGDLVHLALGTLRAVGVPARAVVGFAPQDASRASGAGGPGGAGGSRGHAVGAGRHAWVEWFSGGWFAFDVARGEAAGDLHVAIGHGRGTADVPLLRGVTGLVGPPSSRAGDGAVVDLTAVMTRLS